MSDTPICDFVKEYAGNGSVRAHMPGHKGKEFLGFEEYDVTEFDGADQLFDPHGIIAESEKNASGIFSCSTFYSAEGSSLCIRAMLYMAITRSGVSRTVLAARNVHGSFITSAGLLGIDVQWIYPEIPSVYLSAKLSAADIEKALASSETKPAAVYVTSPDYLGAISDIKGIARVCSKYGVPLLVDNAHGAYLKFLDVSAHPVDLGADLCCDSAHKTLPVLTGGAYLHVNANDRYVFSGKAKHAMSVFASTSPSYLILQSLDKANAYLKDHKKRLKGFLPQMENLKNELKIRGYTLVEEERMKITVDAKKYGYTGDGLAQALMNCGIVCEFHDKDFTVLMLTPENTEGGIERIKKAFLSVPRLSPIADAPPFVPVPERAMSIREAMLSESETLAAEKCAGRITACTSLSCPPAVPILVCGEVITKQALDCFAYYGIKECAVVK